MFAIKDLSDAIEATRTFLGAASGWTWVKLAVIIFFLGGIGFRGPPLPGGGSGEFEDETPGSGAGTDLESAFDFGEMLPERIALAAIVLTVYLAFALAGAIAEFVLLESLRSGEVRVRRYGARNVWPGVRLFGFRLAIGLTTLAIVGGPLLAIYLTSGDVSRETLGLFVGLLAIPVFLGYVVVNRFTTVFVAPTMLQTDLGVIAAWKRFWPTLTANWKEYLVYLLLVWVVQLVIAIALAVVSFVLTLVLAIPLILITLIPFLGIIVVFLGIPLLILITFLIQVPFVAYLRYYALLFLGDTDAELDLIPDQRAAIRGRTGSDGSTGDWGADDGSTGNWDTDDGSGADLDTDDSGAAGWESDDGESDGWTYGENDDSDSDSWDGPDPWRDSSESDDDRDDRDSRDGY